MRNHILKWLAMASASGGLALLFGAIAVLSGRRRPDLNRYVGEVG
jgi:hypothetical protein